MKAVDRSGEVQQMLDTINNLQEEVAGSLQAFGKRIRILPDKDQKNQLNRLELDIPPGW